MTWYGHQTYTNPFKYHPNIIFEDSTYGPSLFLYSTTSRDTVNQFRFLLDTIGVDYTDTLQTLIQLSDRGFVVDSEVLSTISFPNLYGIYSNSSYVITYFEKKIVIPFRSTINGFLPDKIDILLIDFEKVGSFTEWRDSTAPKISLILNGDELTNLPENVIPWESGSSVAIVKGRKKRLIIERVK